MAYQAEGRTFDDVFEAFEATANTGATAAGLGALRSSGHGQGAKQGSIQLYRHLPQARIGLPET
eukprot:11304998-Prorocentrum_lima.AAC.1